MNHCAIYLHHDGTLFSHFKPLQLKCIGHSLPINLSTFLAKLDREGPKFRKYFQGINLNLPRELGSLAHFYKI